MHQQPHSPVSGGAHPPGEPHPRAPASAIVLAGGVGRRFGGDKLAVELDGRPLLHHAILAVAAVAREVIVVVAPDAPAPPLPADAGVPIRVARDAVAGQGPLAGLAAGLAQAREPFAIVVGGDQPALRPGLLGALVAELEANVSDVPDAPGPAIDAVVLVDAGRPWPLPAALRVEAAGPATAAALALGRRSLLSALDHLRTLSLEPARWRPLDPDGASLRDVDHREDLPPPAGPDLAG